MNDSAQNNNQPNVMPVDTSMGDGNSIPPFPVGGANPPQEPVQNAVQAPPAPEPPAPAQGSAAPPAPTSPEPPVADATAGNQPTVNETPPPPGDGQTITTFKPTRGKFGPKGMIATIFGILVLVAATIVGITQVGQTQIFREKASAPPSCGPNAQCGGYIGASDCEGIGTPGVIVHCCPSGDQVVTDPRDGKQYCSSSAPQDISSTFACSTCTSGVCFKADNQNTCDKSQDECPTGVCAAAADTTTGTTTDTTTCTSGQTSCNGQCVNANNDKNNCGTCGNACTGSELCINGNCQTSTAGRCDGGIWYRFSCPYPGPGNDGNGCSLNRVQVSGPNDFLSGFCGSQQVDCSNNNVSFSQSNLNCAQPSASPKTPGGNTMGCGGCDCGVIDANGSNNQQNCYWDGNSCFYSEAACTSGPSNGKAKCSAITLQVNGQYTNKKGKVASGWHTATLTEVQELQAGDTVRLIVTTGSASGANPANTSNFTKGRFIINGGSPIETTTFDEQISPTVGLVARKFRIDYSIPNGVTDFTIQGQVYYAKGQNPGWH